MPEEVFSGSATRLLLLLARRLLGPGAMAEMCRRAGETRSPRALLEPDTWSSYEQFRRLAEVIAAATGGPQTLRYAAEDMWATRSTGVTEAIRQLGSVDAMFENVARFKDTYDRSTDHRVERLGEGDWVFEQRARPPFQPFPEHCAFCAGMLRQVTTTFDLLPAEVVEETCQLDGAPACRFRVRWDPSSRATNEGSVQSRSGLLTARLTAIEETIGDLVSGGTADEMLARVVDAVARAVLAEGFVLAARGHDHERIVVTNGLAPAEAEACATRLEAGMPDPAWTVVEVASRQRSYGHLAAIRPIAAHDIVERRLLHAYANVAAAALDSAGALAAARREREVATALFDLSRSLAVIGTVPEVAQRLATAVPRVVDCDVVIVGVQDVGTSLVHVVATHGLDEETQRRLRAHAVVLDESFARREGFRLLTAGPDLSPQERRALGRAQAMAGVPLRAGGTILGWVLAYVTEGPERLIDVSGLADRLAGLAAVAATAMRNAQLVEQIRFHAEHDPLTGASNARLLETHFRAALLRARREAAHVGVLFVDLDGFKAINDTYGHAEGDGILIAVTERLRGVLRESDTIARVGGDEFVVLLPNVNDEGATVVAKIADALQAPFLIKGELVTVDASIGAATFPLDGDDVGELLHRADVRMYEAKLARQRNRSRT
jgi:diguanylate cyclase (GGDEF)-like protein